MSALSDSCYIPLCKNAGKADITRIAKGRQGNSLGRTKNKTDTPFGTRLRQAFGGASDSDIGRKLGKTPPDVGKWMKTANLPLPKILIDIKRITKCNLDWLLTGEGDSSADPYRFIEDNVRRVIGSLAETQGKTLDEMIDRMLRDSIAARTSALAARYPELETEEIEQMRVLMSVFVELESSASASETSPRKKSVG